MLIACRSASIRTFPPLSPGLQGVWLCCKCRIAHVGQVVRVRSATQTGRLGTGLSWALGSESVNLNGRHEVWDQRACMWCRFRRWSGQCHHESCSRRPLAPPHGGSSMLPRDGSPRRYHPQRAHARSIEDGLGCPDDSALTPSTDTPFGQMWWAKHVLGGRRMSCHLTRRARLQSYTACRGNLEEPVS